MAQRLKINLPDPHGQQALFLNSRATRRVVLAGRRSGKTTAMSIAAITAMLDGKRVLEAAPVSTQTDAFWDACTAALADPIRAGVIKKNETNRLLELLGTPGRIRCRTAHNADTLRGDFADLLLLDEFSLMDEDAWRTVGMPMMLDTGGTTIFAFTPKGLNHSYQLYQQAVSDTTGRWQAFHFVSGDNPHLSKEALAELVQDMSERDYKQEILARFVQTDGSVFRNVDACLTAPPSRPADHLGHMVVSGVDWGRVSDFTAHSILCCDCRRELFLDRFNQIGWKLQISRLLAACERWGVRHTKAESNSIGSPNLESMRELAPQGLTVTGFETSAKSKKPLIESLALCFEREFAKWLPDGVARHELISYETEITAGGFIKYSAPEGGHDDTVICRALAWRAAKPYLKGWSAIEAENSTTGEIGGMYDGYGMPGPTMKKPLNKWDVEYRRSVTEPEAEW